MNSKPKSTKTLYILIMLFSLLFCVERLTAQPTITSFAPLSGKVGDTITISGTGFNTTPANNILFFGATQATVISATATSLTVTVPSGATFAPITLLNTATGLAAFSTQFFNPRFNPNRGAITTSDMEGKVDLATGTRPTSVAISDIDGDGKPDIVITNRNSNSISIFLNTGIGSLVSFATKVDFITDSLPVSVAIGDIDGDGKPDLAVANNSSNTISILRNTSSSGTISFATKVDFATGSGPYSVSIGDINRDGKPDLAIANINSNTVSVLRNTSSSGFVNFAIKQDFGTGGSPRSVAIGDLDNDSKPDLAVVSNLNNLVSILRNTSSGGIISFATVVNIVIGTNPTSAAIGDLDGDGKLDLAIANGGSNSVSILRNTSSIGAINFATKIDYTTGSGPWSVAIGDIDGDGRLDLAIANNTSTNYTISVFRNTGSIGTVSFATKVDFATGTNPISLAIGDINGDGKPDLAVANYLDNTVSVIRNSSQPPPPTIVSFTPTSGNVGTTVTITGTNFSLTPANNILFFGATRAMVTAATATSLTVIVPTGAIFSPITVLNTGTSLAAYSTQFFNPIFSPSKSSITSADIATKIDFATGLQPYSVAIGDIDGDGKSDLAIINRSNYTVSILRNTGSSGSVSFAPKVDFTTGINPQSIAIGDIDGDGKLDLAIGNLSGSSVSVLRNLSSPSSVSFATKVDFTVGTFPYSVAINDLDGDGMSDLAIANRGSNTVSILRNTSVSSTISFAPKVDFATGFAPLFVAIGDINGDGKPDLATANNSSNSFSIFRNTSSIGTLNFAAKLDFGTGGTNPVSIVIGDMDGDGKLDLAETNFGNNTVSVFRNTGSNGTVNFAILINFPSGTAPQSIALGDLDGDSKPDLAVANYLANSISVLRNTGSNGSISFATKLDFASGTKPQSVAIGDIDGDGKPDLATTNYDSNKVSVLRNTPQIPSITTTGVLTSFISCSGKPSVQQVFTVSGMVLSANLIITPPNGFEVSTNSFAGFGSSISLVPTLGIVNNTIIYVRLTNSATGSPSGNVVCTSTGTPTKNLAVTGVVNAVSNTTSTSNIAICPSALPYSWNGRIYNTNTTDTIYLANVLGCDSVTILKLSLKATSTSTTNISICSSLLPYIWNGRTYNVAGTDTVYLTNSVGCDSITILKLIVKPTSTSITNTNVCPSALPYTWNGRTYNTANTDTVYLTNSVGCDSVTILKLIVKTSSSSTTNVSICPYELPYTWNGRTYNTAKTDTVYLTNSVGCDSFNIINLTVKTISTSTSNINICPSALPYTWNSRTYNTSATDTIHLTNAVGCDSVTILKLTIKPRSNSTNNVSICANLLPFIWNGRTYNSNRTDTVYLTNSVGCDSVTILKLTVKPTSTSTTITSICPSALPYIWNGISYNTNRTDTVYLINSVGCDSITILELTVKSISTSTNIVSICPSALPYTWNGRTYTFAKTDTVYLTNSVGCDSVTILKLTIKSTSASTNNLSICPSALPYTWNGRTYTAAKTDTINLTNSIGCDSLLILNLTVNPNPTTSNITGLVNVAKLDTVSYSVSGLSGSVFNWLVSGATIQSGAGTNQIQVKWTASGTQIVNVTETSNQGCIGTQKTLSVNVSPTIGMNELKANNQVIIYPNPFNEVIHITLLNNLKLEKAIIYDLVGNEIIISNKNEIDASSLKSGIYLIMIVDNLGNLYNHKLMKN